MRRLTSKQVALALLALLAGCASPPSNLYTLSATGAPGAPSSDLSVAVGPVYVPASVDRPEIVVTTGPNQVRLEEFNRWASPLENEISRTVAENLVGMLGTPHVTEAPQTLSADAQFRVVIEVQRFDSAPGQAAALDAVWSVRRVKDGKTRTGRTTVSEAVEGTAYDGLVAAHSRAIARLSQDIADAVRALSRAAR
jgi:uncharacterized lipoprotein YmbA